MSQGKRVLLVEDEFLIRLATANGLREAGFVVAEAGSGDEGLQLLEAGAEPDVLFTDVRMPGRADGIELAVRARARTPKLPVLVVSGYANQVRERPSVLSPPAIFISKPYRLSQIVEALNALSPLS